MAVYTIHRHYPYARTQVKAALFSIVLGLMLFACLVISFTASGPIILGTEMNANGTVEYLCLGRDCENFTPMN